MRDLGEQGLQGGNLNVRDGFGQLVAQVTLLFLRDVWWGVKGRGDGGDNNW